MTGKSIYRMEVGRERETGAVRTNQTEPTHLPSFLWPTTSFFATENAIRFGALVEYSTFTARKDPWKLQIVHQAGYRRSC